MTHGQEKSDPFIGAGGAKGRGRGKHGRATRAGHGAGEACPRGLTVYEKQRREGRRNGSPLCSTM